MKAIVVLALGMLLVFSANIALAGEECKTVSSRVTDLKTGEVRTSSQIVCWDTPETDFGPLVPGVGGGSSDVYCASLRLNKPLGCAGPEEIAGAAFGEESYHPGSGLAAAIYNTRSTVLAPQARTLISNALSTHTAALATGIVPEKTAHTNFLNEMKFACSAQSAYDGLHPSLTPWVGGISPAMKACVGTLNRLSGELGQSFGAFYADWLNTLGIELADLNVPQTIINWLSPENSLAKKTDIIHNQFRCNAWYQGMSKNGC